MGEFVSKLMGSNSASDAKERQSAALAAADRDRELQRIAQERQAQANAEAAARDAKANAGATRAPRGKRLLSSSETGGLADTLGAA